MSVTIATHNGSSAHRNHNIRDERCVSKEAHINPFKEHEIWIDEEPQKAYERIFGDAVKEYNERQKRSDRKIDNYYRQICNDKKKHPVYEMIIGIYGKDCDKETGKQIMKEFVNDWKRRNPCLELIGAYYHADEEGEPHVHLDYIPVADGYSKGMSRQTGLVKALEQMGFSKQGKRTAQIQWEEVENRTLDQICQKHGLEVDHPREAKRQHIETSLYKAQQKHDSIVKEVRAMMNERNDMQQDIAKTKAVKKDFQSSLMDMNKRMEKQIQKYDEMEAYLKELSQKKDTMRIELAELEDDNKEYIAQLQEQMKVTLNASTRMPNMFKDNRKVEVDKDVWEQMNKNIDDMQAILTRNNTMARELRKREKDIKVQEESLTAEKDNIKALEHEWTKKNNEIDIRIYNAAKDRTMKAIDKLEAMNMDNIEPLAFIKACKALEQFKAWKADRVEKMLSRSNKQRYDDEYER